MFFRTRN